MQVSLINPVSQMSYSILFLFAESLIWQQHACRGGGGGGGGGGGESSNCSFWMCP